MTLPLLPERHPVRDFFVLDTLDMLPRSDLATMEHPIYSLSTKPDRRRLSYANGDTRLEIIPSSIGLPTVFDKDIIIYCISKLMLRRDRGEMIGPVVRLTTHDMLVETNRPTNNVGYERLLPALNRLRGVVINTTIATGAERTTRGFGLIDDFEYNRKGSMFAERLRYLEIKLSDWILRAIQSAEVLPINRQYFRLRSPLDRRIYEVARKHCGRQPSWRIGLPLFQSKVGSTQAARKFASHLRELVRSNHLPDYAVTLEGTQAVFYRKSEVDPSQKRSGPIQSVVETAARKRIRAVQKPADDVELLAPDTSWQTTTVALAEDATQLRDSVVDWSPLDDATVHRLIQRHGAVNVAAAWTTYKAMRRGAPWDPYVDWGERFASYIRKLSFTRHQDGDGVPVARRLQPATLDAARRVAPAWDAIELERIFFAWNAARGAVLKKPDAAFMAWLPSFTKGRTPS